MGLFIPGEPENLLPMRGDKLAGEQQHSARRAIPYSCTGRAHNLMTIRWDRVPCPPALMVDRFALTTHRRLPGFALRLVRVVLLRSNRSIF
jgi:hypothetical protein